MSKKTKMIIITCLLRGSFRYEADRFLLVKIPKFFGFLNRGVIFKDGRSIIFLGNQKKDSLMSQMCTDSLTCMNREASVKRGRNIVGICDV